MRHEASKFVAYILKKLAGELHVCRMCPVLAASLRIGKCVQSTIELFNIFHLKNILSDKISI